MKYEYTGENNHRSIELVAYKIMGKKDTLQKGMIIDVPNDNDRVITALNASGVFKKVNETRNVKKQEEKKKEDK